MSTRDRQTATFSQMNAVMRRISSRDPQPLFDRAAVDDWRGFDEPST
ncbi:hypothetical protein [Halobellus sp. GM3]